MWVTEWAVTAYELRARAIVKTWQPDLVQIEYHLMAQYASALDGCRAPRVLVEHEPGIKAAPYLQASHPVIRQIMHYFDAIAWKRYEPSIIKKMQTVVVFTEEDRQALAPFAQSTPVVRIPLGTELSQQSLNQLDHRPLSLLFVGNFVHPPNVDAAHRLINSIFPQVRERCPEVSLYIVGSQPSPFSKTRNENVIITGYVPDVTPYLDQAAVVVAPLRLGGGMRVKVLEALAAGKVVVASPLAVEGLNVVDGEQVMLAETDEQFCQTIVQLLESPERRDRLARNARAWACANLGWEKSIEAYETLYQSLLQPPPPVD
jgi:glycosyltransferase involved in cell wall biosynthesis